MLHLIDKAHAMNVAFVVMVASFATLTWIYITSHIASPYGLAEDNEDHCSQVLQEINGFGKLEFDYQMNSIGSKLEPSLKAGAISTGYSANVRSHSCPDAITCIIWIFWDSGWDKAPPLQQACRASWESHNPNYDVRAINLIEAERLIHINESYDYTLWLNASIQAKSDIIRIELLSKYGGVWVDSTLHCNEPLDNWLQAVLVPARVFMFERLDKEVVPEYSPWVASWFMAASNHSLKMMLTWRDRVRHIWSKEPYPTERYGYFWFHRTFTNLTKGDPLFKRAYTKIPLKDAAGPHCMDPKLPCLYFSHVPHVYKTTAETCRYMDDIIVRLHRQNIK